MNKKEGQMSGVKTKSSKMVILTLTLSFLLIGIGVLYLYGFHWNKYSHEYLVPDNYVGEIQVIFGVQNADPLPQNKKSFVYLIPGSGILKTSNEMKPGQSDFFYLDRSGEKKRIGLYDEYIHGLGTGNRKDANSGENLTVVRYFIGSQNQYNEFLLKSK